ncbi:MAG: enoyl-CoA hydratase/isomerase family protein [Longimicrobiales bacterium]
MDTITAALVLTSTDGAVLSLTLNRPDRLNAVTRELYESLRAAVRRAAGDEAVRSLILTGAGRAFCAGADVKAHAERPLPPRARRRYARAAQRANLSLQRCVKPVVAAVNGAAVGAGLELALSCDFIVVAEDAQLRLPELALGTFFGGGVAHTLPQRVGLTRAKELLFLGDFFSGRDAVAIGLANAAVPREAVPAAALALAQRLAELAPVPLRRAKELLHRAPHLSRRAVLREEARALRACMATGDWAEGLAAQREQRSARYTGA